MDESETDVVARPEQRHRRGQIRDGRVVIIYNHSWGLKSLGRGKLNVAISHDDGLTWTPSSTVVLESFDDGAISDINVDKKNQKKPIK